MATFHITLSESLYQFVTEQVAEKGLDHSDQYFEQLIEAEQRRSLEEYYWEKVQEGLASGPPIRVTEENREAFWNGIKEEILQRLQTRRAKESPTKEAV